MKKSFWSTLLLTCFISLYSIIPSYVFSNSFEFESKNATMSLQDGSTLVLNNLVNGYNGTLFKSNDARIQGQNIYFNNGTYRTPGRKCTLLGTYDPNQDSFMLFDNETFVGSGIAWQPISIYGTNARIQGQPTFVSDIILNDSNALVTFDIQSTLNCNVVLNQGQVQLDDTLHFANYCGFLTDGTVNLFNNRVIFGSAPLDWYNNIQWSTAGSLVLNNKVNVYGTHTLNGSIAINGNGNIIDLSYGGSLVIPTGSYVYLSNVIIKGLGNSRGTIQFADQSSVLFLSNVTFELVDDFETNKGMININGPCTVITQNKSWNIGGTCLMLIDGVTVWTDPAGASQSGSIHFEDSSSQLELLESGTIKNAGCCDQVASLETRIEALENQDQEFMSQLVAIEAQIETLVTMSQFEACCTTMQQQIDALNTSTTFLQFEIEQLQTDTHCGHVIRVEGTMTFDQQTLLNDDKRLTFEFAPCVQGVQPTLTFVQNSIITLPANSELFFRGAGIVQIQDGVQFDFMGTNTLDQAYMNIGDRTTLKLDSFATAHLTGKGRLELSDWGMINLTQPCQFNIGMESENEIRIELARFGGIQLIDDSARLFMGIPGSYITSDMYGTINAYRGTVNYITPRLQYGVEYLTHLITRYNNLFETKYGQIFICDTTDNSSVYFDINGSVEKTNQLLPVLLPVKLVR